ncbi:MAG: transporter substrate-binding domain-containing protein [Cyclobacteriaceae bacterium]|nr:transporter substrate-binding domain-containing protein [Cyclobacteriaceae bacterium]
MLYKRIFILFIGLLLGSVAFGQTYKVGIYDNPPMVYMGEDGKPTGFFVELLEHIAQLNGWKLEYDTCSFAECRDKLLNDQIDILPDFGHSAARDSLFYFNQTPVISTWAEIYYADNRSTPINDIMSLEGLRIASLDGDYFSENGSTGLLDICKELGINIDLYRVESYPEAMRLVEKGVVDAALVSKVFGDYNAHNFDVKRSEVMISHLSLRYGLSKMCPHAKEIQHTVDDELRRLISDESSMYYKLKEKYFIGAPATIIPKWLWEIVLTLLMVVAALIVASMLLRYQVERRTHQLKMANRNLRASEQEARLALNTIEASKDLAFWSRPGRGFIRVNNTTLEVLGYTKEEMLALPVTKLVPEELQEDFQKRLRLANDNNPHIRFESEIIKKSGERFPVEVSLDQFDFEGVTYICGFARDITERKLAFRQRQELMAHLEDRNKELNCLYAVSKLISDEHNSIESILQEAAELIPKSWQYSDIACSRIKCSFGEFVSANFGESEWKLVAPITTNKEDSGTIEVFYSEKRPERFEGPFLEEERNLIDALGELLGNMLNVKGAEQKIIATIMDTEDQERKRISKEIHDSLGQTLSAIALNMDMVDKEIDLLSEKQQERFKKVATLVNDAVVESRNIAHNLMPSTLNDFGYSLAVENMIDSLEGATDIQFKFYSNYEPDLLDQTVELGLYRITQEAVNNSIKHSDAKSITIQLMCYPDMVILTIEDDGKGFDPKNTDEISRFGLNSMENRARSINAEFSIDSELGKGTVVTLQMHLKQNKKDENTDS